MSQRLADILQAAVARGDVPGAVAMATDGTSTLCQAAAGVRQFGGDVPMTLDTIFWIASLTKAVTSIAAMQLVEQGCIGLWDPLGPIVPKLADLQVLTGFDDAGQPVLRPARREVTLHDLLTHTSGFCQEVWNPNIRRYIEVTGVPTSASGLNAALDRPLAFDPGDRWEYGIGIDWAGKVVEAVSGQGLGAYFAEHIFGPLGMVDTQFGRPDSDRVASSHTRLPDGGLKPGSSGRPGKPELEGGGGGLYSTASDYLKLLAMLLRGGDNLLRPDTVASMMRNQIAPIAVRALPTEMPHLSNDAEFFPGVAKGWGYGFMTTSTAGHAGRAANSVAWAGLANCYYWLDPSSRIAGVLMAQLLPFADPAVLGLFDAFETSVYEAQQNR
ncbi:serine hydrolase [Acidisphaera sp. L21]|uniref:serine hydrolase domain-containing protein n=1 Tax=Acidisphaera sp. L21 TaxID=1641851 RepID=UPI00131C5425|nr:serine hydrolase domain-containing protein [Acidisphaera sp. L21]